MPPSHNGQPRRRYPAEILTDAEVCLLLDACDCRSSTGVRNRTLIAVLYRGGLRINEALDLFPKDIDLESGSIRILNGKGGRARTVGIDPAHAHSVAGFSHTAFQHVADAQIAGHVSDVRGLAFVGKGRVPGHDE